MAACTLPILWWLVPHTCSLYEFQRLLTPLIKYVSVCKWDEVFVQYIYACIVERMHILSILFAQWRGMTRNTGWAQVGAGTGMCLPTIRTDRSFDLKPLGFAIASWFREVPVHMAQNGCLHWENKVSFMAFLWGVKDFPLEASLFSG